MQFFKYPGRDQQSQLLKRPIGNTGAIDNQVRQVLDRVRAEGDVALFDYTRQWDGVQLITLLVNDQELQKAESQLSVPLKKAVQVARENIATFHEAQRKEATEVETTQGVVCWRKSIPLETVGLYIPGGTAPLFSTLLMLGVPATLASCSRIVLCTPPNEFGQIHPAILYVAHQLGITEIYKVGGAQAIAAMTYGTESIPSVDKIFGPGNAYVTKAKELVQAEGMAIDMPAGPSEVLVIADKTADPDFVAADLLSQAEHGADSQTILLSDSESQIQDVLQSLSQQLSQLPRKAIASEALNESRAILLSSLEDCLEWSNAYAPEHLILATENARNWVQKVVHAGSVFLGNYSCESAGDYASGTNHTLPTNGYARQYSGVSLDSFMRFVTFQELSAQGLENLGPTIEILAEAEKLMAHKNAVTLRLQKLRNAKD